MIVCHCFRVSDREIRGCVRDGAVTVSAIGRVCGAGAGCGGCRPEIESIVSHELKDEASALLPLASLLREVG